MRGHHDGGGTPKAAVTYLRFAKRMLRGGRPAAMRRLRMSAELADMLEAFPIAQLRTLAASNFALCSFRVAELPIAAFGGYERQAGIERPHDVWAGRLLRGFAVAGLIVQAAALAMTLAPSLAARSQAVATAGGAAMAVLALGIACCWRGKPATVSTPASPRPWSGRSLPTEDR